jgi:imidazolonepropionase
MFKMIPKEVIEAATIHGARSMAREREIGSLESGKQADLLLLDIPNYRYIPYHFGVDHAEVIVKKGKVVFTKSLSH